MADRKVEGLIEVDILPLPALVTVLPDIATPRIPGVKDTLMASKKAVIKVGKNELTAVPPAQLKTQSLKAARVERECEKFTAEAEGIKRICGGLTEKGRLKVRSGKWRVYGFWGKTGNELFELLSIGRSLADKYGTTLAAFAFQDEQAARDCIARGADRAVVLKYQGEEGPLDVFMPAIVEEAKGKDPDMLLIASTYRLKELAARIAERLKAGLCSDCIRLVFNEGEKSVEWSD